MRNITLLTILLLVFSCHKIDNSMDDFNRMYGGGTEDAGDLIEKVSAMKIYFGHQSVGRNILAGMEAWEKETGMSMEIIESREFSTVPETGFVHFAIGHNGDPRGKVDDFVSLMGQVRPEENPIAFFKFCYVDVTSETDVESEYTYFKENMLELIDRYPNIRFIASTVPYTFVQSGPKSLVKKVLGKDPYGAPENIKRNEFNEMILSDLGTIMPVFDLAALESTLPDGSVETYRYKGAEYPCLPDLYRSDYGHLNSVGSKMISFNLLAFLSEEI